MKTYLIAWLILLALIPRTALPAEGAESRLQHAVLQLENPPVDKFEHPLHPAAQWFGENQFGLFIPWGISSVMARQP